MCVYVWSVGCVPCMCGSVGCCVYDVECRVCACMCGV